MSLVDEVQRALRDAPILAVAQVNRSDRMVEVCSALSTVPSVIVREDRSLSLARGPGGLQLIRHLAQAGMGGPGRTAWLLMFAHQQMAGALDLLIEVHRIGEADPALIETILSATKLHVGALADAERAAQLGQAEAI